MNVNYSTQAVIRGFFSPCRTHVNHWENLFCNVKLPGPARLLKIDERLIIKIIILVKRIKTADEW
jgi:hypothetical protein